MIIAAQPAFSQSYQPLNFWSTKNTSDQCECLIRWTERLKTEYPEEKGSFRMYEYSVNLYANEYFIPVFGKPFPQLGRSERGKIVQTIKKCASSKEYAGTFAWVKGVVMYAFANRDRMSFTDMVSRLEVHQPERDKAESIRKFIAGMRAERGKVVDVRVWESQILRSNPNFYPSEIADLKEFSLRKRMSMLYELLQKERAGYEGNKLSYDEINYHTKELRRRYAGDIQQVPESERVLIYEEIDRMRLDLFKTMIASELEFVKGFNSLKEIIEKGNDWYFYFQANVLEKYDIPGAKETMSLYLEKRKKALEDHFPQIKEEVSSEKDIEALNRSKASYTKVPMRDDGAYATIRSLIDSRIEAVQRGYRAKGGSGYDWYDIFSKAKTSTLSEMIGEIGQINLVFSSPSGVFTRYVKDDLKSRGIREGPGSPLTLMVETGTNFFATEFSSTSTNPSTRISTKEYERRDTLFAYTISARIVANGIVFRESNFYKQQLVLSGGGIAISVRHNEPADSFSRKLEGTVKALFDDVFKASFFVKGYVVKDEAWRAYANENMGKAPQLYSTYLHNQKGPNQYWKGLTEIGAIHFGENEERRVIGWKETILLRQQMSGSGGVFGRALNRSADDYFNGALEWLSFFREKSIGVPPTGGYLENKYNNWRPILVHEFSSEHTTLAPVWYQGLHAIVGHSYILEPNCFVQHDGVSYRLSAATIYDLRVEYGVKELFKSIRKMTDKSIKHFSQGIPAKN